MMPASAHLIALYTVVRREIMRIARLWLQTLLLPTITIALYFLIFGKVIGERIGGFDGGFSYMQFITPGLVMMSIVTTSYGNTSSSFFFLRFNRAVEEMLVSPMPNWIILVGYLTGSLVRGLAIGAILLAISMPFAAVVIAHPAVALASVLLGSTIFALLGFINSLYAKTLDDIGHVSTFVLTPLAYLGGVFYPIELLDPPWQDIARINPMTHMIGAFRYGVLGTGEYDIGLAFTTMSILATGLFATALLLLRRGVGTRG
jgi:ABC-2 type transport system permease protein